MNKKSDHITLIDPSVGPGGAPPENAGDCIIYSSVERLMLELFPEKEIVRISAHQLWGAKEKELIRNATYCFAAGSNMLTSDIRNFHRFSPEKKKGFYLFPGVSGIILLGVGWYRYQPKPDLPTSIYYKKILAKNFLHSVRDSYAVRQLSGIQSIHTCNTSCPTVWDLDTAFPNCFNPAYKYSLFTLNNNYPDPESDNRLIRLIFEQDNGPAVFFPQVKLDLTYLESLDTFRQNKNRFLLLDDSYSAFLAFADNESFNYIGTRLHAGIAALQRRMPAMILAVDNRAAEIAGDIQLWVRHRTDFPAIENWICKSYLPPRLQLPAETIKNWKNQFISTH